jgi:hypothetical protein
LRLLSKGDGQSTTRTTQSMKTTGFRVMSQFLSALRILTPQVNEVTKLGRDGNERDSRVVRVAHDRADVMCILILRGGANESLNTRVG